MSNARKNTTKLLEAMDEGSIDPATLARDLMGYMSEQDVTDFISANDLEVLINDEDE